MRHAMLTISVGSDVGITRRPPVVGHSDGATEALSASIFLAVDMAPSSSKNDAASVCPTEDPDCDARKGKKFSSRRLMWYLAAAGFGRCPVSGAALRKRRRGLQMKNVLAGLTALVFSCLVATSAHATFASGPDVCAYRVTNVFGVLCPLRNGQTACLSQSAKIGNCDTRLECFGGPGFFCKATLIPKSGPEKACPFGSVRPRGFTCFQPIVFGTRTPTPTAPPVGTDTATFTPTDTPLADTPPATATGAAAG